MLDFCSARARSSAEKCVSLRALVCACMQSLEAETERMESGADGVSSVLLVVERDMTGTRMLAFRRPCLAVAVRTIRARRIVVAVKDVSGVDPLHVCGSWRQQVTT